MHHRPLTLQRLLPAAVGALFGLHPIAEADTFWHLTLGRAVLRYGSRVVPEPSAFKSWTEPCVVPEWLWDLFTYGLYRSSGMGALSLLPALFGALTGYLVGCTLDANAPQSSRVLRASLGVFAVCALAEILDVRPNLAFAVLLVAFPWLTQRYAKQTDARALAWSGVALVVTAQLWAQLHASFVLAVAIFVSVVVPARLRQDKRFLRERLRVDGALLVGLLLTVFTCAHGTQVVDLVLRHSGTDAARHIQDMKPFDWAMLAPFAWPVGAVLSVALLMAALPWLVAAELDMAAVLLALLGAALTFTAARFSVAWVLLLLPLSAAGIRVCSELGAQRPGRLRSVELVSVALTLCTSVWTYRRVDEQAGPMFQTGARMGAYPVAASRYLLRLPAGSPVFTDYAAGGPLGFWLDGRVRTFVDGRTPLYFDDTDAAVSRDVLASPSAMDLAFARYGVRAAVVERAGAQCQLLAERWSAVVIEPRYTTFVPKSGLAQLGAPLSGLAACGPFYLSADACQDGGAALLRSIDRLAGVQRTRFAGFLHAAALLQCQRGSGAAALATLPTERDARLYHSAYRWYASWALLLAGRTAEATDLLADALSHGDALAVRVLLEPAASRVPVAQLRRLLERGLELMDDNAPAALRARLALVCAAQGDAECARFQGLRAYLRGDAASIPALQWASAHHPSPRVRQDLLAWLALHAP